MTWVFKHAYNPGMDKSNGINTKKLREYREKLGLSQSSLDLLAGIGNKTTRNAEMGKGITVRSLLRIAKALGVPAAVFLD